jgi:alkylation response protein AidB-like acyl-CoA dehydrogenase
LKKHLNELGVYIMDFDLTKEQIEARRQFRKFVDETIVPYAEKNDREEIMPRELMAEIAARGYWAPELPEEYGGIGMDMLTLGILTEEIGRGCCNVRNLLGVQGMVSQSILRFGTKEQRETWLPKIGAGEIVAAFGLTEANIGSDARNIATEAKLEGDKYIISGQKKWISFGQNADLILLFAKCQDKPSAFLIEKDTPGLTVRPLNGLLGYRGSMVGELTFEGCEIPKENLVGMLGAGVSYVAVHGLIHGRYSTAWGCVGLAQGCLEHSLAYSNTRRQFGVLIKEHQSIQNMIADMIAGVTAGRQLCYRAGYLQENKEPNAMMEISLAKYFTSRMAMEAAANAVQIHAANGCGPDYPVQRHFRDAKVSEIVEGSSQIQQGIISRYAHKLFQQPQYSS